MPWIWRAAGLIAIAILAATPAAAIDIPFILSKPAGAGPFPAVVILHDCSGLGQRGSGEPRRWAALLTSRGYVTIMPDSFSSRGAPTGVCNGAGQAEISVGRRVRDAYDALAFLATQPFVDARRVAVFGNSHGGTSVLGALVASEANARRSGAGFAAAVALYPGCGRTMGDWSVERDKDARQNIVGYGGVYRPLAPLLILIGKLDDWTPAEPCQRMADMARDAGQPVELILYPNARHGFDSNTAVRYDGTRVNLNAPGGHGATTGGNAEAWRDAVVQVTKFLGERLAATDANRAR